MNEEAALHWLNLVQATMNEIRSQMKSTNDVEKKLIASRTLKKLKRIRNRAFRDMEEGTL